MDADLSYFAKEDLFPSHGNGNGARSPNERVHPIFKRTYSLSPLDILIRKEEEGELKQRGAELQHLCQRYFTLPEYNFLVDQLGVSFGRRWRMPLEFRDFTPQEFEEYFDRNVEKFRKRIGILMENASVNGNTKRVDKETLNNPYFLAGREKVIDIYKSVTTKRLKFPKGFFDQRNKRVARILVQHLIDDILQIPHGKVLPNVSRKEFEENKLGLLLDICYAGHVSPVYRAIMDAYPPQHFPDIHIPDYRPDDPVKALLDTLEAQ